MKYVLYIDNWETFSDVPQDAPGTVATTGGGLYTRNLMNCMCLILTDEENKYGMLHISPGHDKTIPWITSLRENVGATAAIVAGANGSGQSDERQKALVAALHGLTIVDETKAGWVPAALRPNRGSNSNLVGYAAVCATTGQYALSMLPFRATINPAQAIRRSSRGSSDGGCVIQ